jgi:uncharacterized protein YndB with AHSA1/START domain
MEITREVELDAPADEVWELLTDPDELAAWVGDEVRAARFDDPDEGARRIGWTWSPDGEDSRVEIAVVPDGDRSIVRVVEHTVAVDLLSLELRCLTRAMAMA